MQANISPKNIATLHVDQHNFQYTTTHAFKISRVFIPIQLVHHFVWRKNTARIESSFDLTVNLLLHFRNHGMVVNAFEAANPVFR